MAAVWGNGGQAGQFPLEQCFRSRYSRLLEESSGASPALFAWLLFYAASSLIALSPFVSIPFLGTALSSSIVYIWARRNPDTRLSFLGLLVFPAPYLPWVLMAFSLVVHGNVPKDEICGVIVGHTWYFFSDVYPPLHDGRRPLEPPQWWVRLFEGVRELRTSENEVQNIQGRGAVEPTAQAH
ncbi:hypothetical protein KEM54_006409 [Ascosphaera aggregata]|nr:hypothetical protein KEM54_006409 [Ascosphaera aggregata]